jgi:hypothetical protein
MKTWLKIIIALYLAFAYVRFIAGKMVDPANPAGYITPSCLRSLGQVP